MRLLINCSACLLWIMISSILTVKCAFSHATHNVQIPFLSLSSCNGIICFIIATGLKLCLISLTYHNIDRELAMSKLGNEEVVEMACLGRPFRMGMLYDARSDMLIPGVTLWGDAKLNNYIRSTDQIGSDFEVVSEDSLESKASHLDVSASLKLSFLGGMVEVSGSAKYLDDRKTSKQQSRVSLKYWSTTKFEQLTMDQLATEHIEYHDVFDKKTATHIVTGILYGADAIFVFDRKIEEGENTREVHGSMEVLIKALPGITEIKGKAELNMNDEEKKEASKLTCKFHGDVQLPKNPTTFPDALAVYQQLPSLLVSEKGRIHVPKKVWLYPLSKLDSKAAQLTREISVGFVHQAQAITEELLDLSMRCNDLLKSNVCSHFLGIQTQLSKFKAMLSEYKTTFSKMLKRILPSVREGQPETLLADLFQQKNNSPFNSNSLMLWLQDKEQEFKVLNAYLKMMKDMEFALAPGDLDAHIFSNDLVLCFTLKVASSGDDYLKQMRASLRSEEPGQISTESAYRSWYKDRAVMTTLRNKAKRFVNFARTNKGNTTIKYVVADSSEDDMESGCAIVLYDNGTEQEFEPPSTPSNIRVSPRGITHDSIRLEWTKPEFGSENVKYYTVSCQVENDPSDSWDTIKTKGKETSICVNDLKEDHKYRFKVRAESKVGMSQDCEVSDFIQTTSKKGESTVAISIYSMHMHYYFLSSRSKC